MSLNSRLQLAVIPVTVSSITVILMAAMALTLPLIPAVVCSFLIGCSSTCVTTWLVHRKGMDGNDCAHAVGGNGVLIMFAAAMVPIALRLDFSSWVDYAQAWLTVGPMFGPVCGTLVVLAFASFKASYPGRVERWFSPSREATHAYHKQLIREAAHRESIAEIRLKDARQARKNAEDRLLEIESRDFQPTAYRG